ncbi:MAG: hypothetical protein JXB85_07010 [Anaerolineales bacterium]|nr:hypothetical protein [Anaerolineales bacterium]
MPHWIWTLGAAALLSLGGYLLASRFYYGIGFPLDDAWIHQTYARNLAASGEWAFLPGRTSGGSTAPLWTALLAPGHLFGLGPHGWTFLLGLLALWGLAVLGEKAIRDWVPMYRPRLPWMGVALALEWHLVWAAGSGMETLLHALLVTLVLVMVASGTRCHLATGLLIGLTVWVRPDGITLLGPALLGALLIETTWSRRLRALSGTSLGFGALFVLYLLFNLALSGSPWPTTFYAKQAEYAVLLQTPFGTRLAGEALQFLVGVGIAVLPGFVLILISFGRQRLWRMLLPAVWLVGYLGLYAMRLPVTYQHGRYLIPAMAIYFLLGLSGLIEVSERKLPGSLWMVQVAWKGITGLLLILFWGRGAFAYAQDVAVIESEMVQTARWVADNLPAEALIAAHDIGALGYYGEHEIVDLAGLISPEVIPFLRDEDQLAAYLDGRGADVLVAFPGWYPVLTRDLVPLYVTGALHAPAMGQANMTVYRWVQP